MLSQSYKYWITGWAAVSKIVQQTYGAMVPREYLKRPWYRWNRVWCASCQWMGVQAAMAAMAARAQRQNSAEGLPNFLGHHEFDESSKMKWIIWVLNHLKPIQWRLGYLARSDREAGIGRLPFSGNNVAWSILGLRVVRRPGPAEPRASRGQCQSPSCLLEKLHTYGIYWRLGFDFLGGCHTGPYCTCKCTHTHMSSHVHHI